MVVVFNFNKHEPVPGPQSVGPYGERRVSVEQTKKIHEVNI